MELRKIIAVDFDGTLSLGSIYPALGDPNIDLINELRKWQNCGNRIILWTCRDGVLLDNAIDFCEKYGLIFDAVNDNLPEIVKFFENNSRKIYADFYIDDKNKKMEEFIKYKERKL